MKQLSQWSSDDVTGQRTDEVFFPVDMFLVVCSLDAFFAAGVPDK